MQKIATPQDVVVNLNEVLAYLQEGQPSREVASAMLESMALLVYPQAKVAARPDGDWGDRDPKAPKTPWGPAQMAYQALRGVVWYSTAGHGGLKIAPGIAKRMLTPAAIKMGESWGGALWYEEDVAYAIPFYEHPEWARILDSKMGGRSGTREQLEKSIRSYFPRYFKMLEEGYQLPQPPKVGDTLVFKRPMDYRTRKFKAGDKVRVYEVRRGGTVVFQDDQGSLYRLMARNINDGDVELVK